MQTAALSLFIGRMADIHTHYADVIESGSHYALSYAIENDPVHKLPIISDRDVETLRWAVKKMPVRNSGVVNSRFLSFLILLKGKVEERILNDHRRFEKEIVEAFEATWIRLFKAHGIGPAKQEFKRMWGNSLADETMKRIFNQSYQNAKAKWETTTERKA